MSPSSSEAPKAPNFRYEEREYQALERRIVEAKSVDEVINFIRSYQAFHGNEIPSRIVTRIFSHFFPVSVESALETMSKLDQKVGVHAEQDTIARLIDRLAVSSNDAVIKARQLAEPWQIPIKNHAGILSAVLCRSASRSELVPAIRSLWEKDELPYAIYDTVLKRSGDQTWKEVIGREITKYYKILPPVEGKNYQKGEKHNSLHQQVASEFAKSKKSLSALATIYRRYIDADRSLANDKNFQYSLINFVKHAEIEQPARFLGNLNRLTGCEINSIVLVRMLDRLIDVANLTQTKLAAIKEVIYILEQSGVTLDDYVKNSVLRQILAARYEFYLNTRESQKRGINFLLPVLQENTSDDHYKYRAFKVLHEFLPEHPLTKAVEASIGEQKNTITSAGSRGDITMATERENSGRLVSPVYSGLFDRPVDMKAINQVLKPTQ